MSEAPEVGSDRTGDNLGGVILSWLPANGG